MTEADKRLEREHLREVLALISAAREALRRRLFTEGNTLLEEKKRATEEFRSWEAGDDQADTAEYAFDAMQMSVDDRLRLNEVRKFHRMQRMLSKTYFGRIDWDDGLGAEPVYIGVHGYYDRDRFESVVCDWRAPIASLFYEHEKGPARFIAPDGKESKGHITLKRQFDIQGGEIRAMFDTDVRVMDALLMDALSRDTSGAMHAIYSTLQREQYRLIRASSAANMVIYGVAGSGKTSIALHRIAWLIYARKGALNGANVRVLSPNRMFSSYIAGVLPELGEEPVRTLSADDIAGEAVNAESRYEQLEYVLSLDAPEKHVRVHDMRIKSGEAFAARLEAFLEGMFERLIEPQDVEAGGIIVPAAYIRDVFLSVMKGAPFTERSQALPGEVHAYIIAKHNEAKGETAAERLARDDDSIILHTAREIGEILRPQKLKELNKSINDMLRFADHHALYALFLEEQGMTYRRPDGEKVRYEDAFPLMLIMGALYGADKYDDVAHLVIDEMQDYTPAQYLWIRSAFACERTILGDMAQYVQPSRPELSEAFFSKLLGGALTVHHLNKSYRSTVEIGRFCARIIGLDDVEWVERHGEEPSIITCRDDGEQLERVRAVILKAQEQGRAVAVLLKTLAAARAFYDKLAMPDTRLLDEHSEWVGSSFVTAAYIAKGMEFDCVVVPDADAGNYRSQLDRQQLYVACTRALHELTLLCTGKSAAN